VLNFFLVLVAAGDKKAFEFISGNLFQVSLRHMQQLVASKRKPSFINQTRDEVIVVVVNHIEKI
jgi:hypothetical protein